MDEDDHSFIDLVEGTPSPVFKRIRRMGSNNLSRPSLSNQGSTLSVESISSLNRAPNLSTGSLSPSKSPGLLREEPRPYLSLPGEINFAEERARAIQRKKHKDKTSPFKLPKHAKSDFVKSSTLLTSSPPKTYQVKRPTTQGTSAQPSSTITGTQSSKRKNGFTVPTMTSPPKPHVNRDRAIGWPSSSDSSSDDDLFNNMAFKAKRIKHRQGSGNSHSHKPGNSTNSLSICNHMRHSGTNYQSDSSNSGTSETACKHGKNGTANNSKQFRKRMSDAVDGLQKKAKKMKTTVEETCSGSSSLNRKTNFDGVIAKPCNSSLIKAGVTRFGNNTEDLHNFGTTFTSTQRANAQDTERPGRSDDLLSSKHCKERNRNNYSDDCASKSNKPRSTSTSNTVPPNFDCDLSPIRNSSHTVMDRNPHTYNSDKSPTLVSSISAQNFYKSPTVDRHTNSSHATTSPSPDRRRQISRNLSPGFDQQTRTNFTSRQTTPSKITKPPSPIFSPPDIIGHNSNESYDNRQPKTPERPRPKLPRPHPYGRSSTIRSPNRPSSFSPARNLGSPYAAFIDSLRTETLDGGISRAREEMRRRSRDRQARSSGHRSRMDEDDHSFIDLVEGTPSPVFKRIRRMGSSNLSRPSLSNQDNTSSVESISALNRAPNLSTGSLSASKSPGLLREEPRPYLSLPGEINFAEERARAIQRKKHKDKTSPFKLPKHAKSDFVKSSTLLTSSPPKTYQVKRPTTQGTSAQPSSTITGTQSSKRKNGFTVPTMTSPPKPHVNRDRAIGWPSSSDSSSDDELFNNMAFKAKRMKHRQGSDNSHSHKSGNSTNSLSICNHMRHFGTKRGDSSNSGSSETGCIHGKNGTANNSKQFGKRMSDADDGSQRKAKKMKTTVEETSSGSSSLNRKTNFDGVIAKPCNSSLIKAGVTRFGNNTDELHNFGATFTSTQRADDQDTERPGRSDDWLSSKHCKERHSSTMSGDCASKSNKPSSTSNANTVPPNFDCSLSPIRNSSHGVVGRNPHTYNSDKSPTLVSSVSVQNFYKSPTVDRHTNSSHATTSPSLDRRRQISRNLSPGFDQQTRTNFTSRQTTPSKITKPPSPIFSPPDIIGHNSNESYGNRQPKTPERPRPKLPRPHPYGRSSTIRSPHRPSLFSPARNLGSPYAAFIDSLKTETLDGGISRAREEMRRRSRDRQARSSGNSTKEDLVVVDLTTPESSRAVKQIEQMEKDEEMARKLQEELDKEFAMTLAQQQESHSHEHEHRHFTDPGADYDMYSSHHHDNQRPSRPGRLWEDQPMDLGQHFGQFSPRPAQRGGNSSRNRRTRGGGARGMDENQLDQLLAELGNTVDTRMFQLLTPPTRGRRRGRGRNHYVTPDRGGNDYDELLRLGEMIGDAVKKGLSKSEMNRLPTFAYKKSDGENQEVECNICMCNYEDGDMQKILPCFHSYHSECIDQWIAKNATCPVCRVEIKL